MKQILTEDLRKNFKLAIATPFYEVKAYSPYIVSLLESMKVLNELKIDYDYIQISGDSYVDRAKNSLVHRFLQSEGTHLMMIDSDLSWDAKGFMRLLKASILGAEVVGGTYPNKNNWDTFGVIPIKTEDGYFVGIEKEGLRLLEMRGIPGGFLIYSRKAFERTMPNVAVSHEPINNVDYYEFFKCSVERNDYKPKSPEEYYEMSKEDLIAELALANKKGKGIKLGEDIYFQARYREMGGKIFLEPNISFQHWGVKGWEGNFHDKHIVKEEPNA